MPKTFKSARVTREQPVTSWARDPVEGIVPPVSFMGELDIGPSGVWHPTKTIELLGGVCTAQAIGTGLAGFAVMKRSPFETEALKGFTMPSTHTQVVFTMFRYLQPAIITPQDGVYVISFSSSGHLNVTIRFNAIELDR